MYKRLAGAETQPEIDDVRAELHDRYGAPPEAVLNLLAAGEIRLHCERLGIAQLDRKRTQVEQGTGKHLTKSFVEMLHIKFADPKAGGAPATAPGEAPAPPRSVDPSVLMRLVSRNSKRGAQFTPQGILRWPLTSAKAADVLAETRALLDGLDAPTR
jgi:transcription-repair coupling factor (superfamily II helicase)